MHGLVVFRSLAEALRQGYMVMDRTKSGYFLRIRTRAGFAMALVELERD